MDAIKSAAGSLKSKSIRQNNTVNVSKCLENKEFRQVLRFELNLLLDAIKGIKDEQDRKSMTEKLIQLSLDKCHKNMLMIGKADTRTSVILSGKQQTTFYSFFPTLAREVSEFHAQSKAEPDNPNIKRKLEENSDGKYYWFIEEGMNDYQSWSVLTCARKDGKNKSEKNIPPIRLNKLNKLADEPQFFPGSFDRMPPNLNGDIRGKYYRITFTESGPAKPRPCDVIMNLSDAKNKNLCQAICSELASAMEFHGENKQANVEKLIDVYLAMCCVAIKGENEAVQQETCNLLFLPLLKARIAAGKQFQENPSDPCIQVPLEGDFGGEFSLFVEKRYGGEFFLSMETWEKNKTNVTSSRIELMKAGMPCQHEYALSAPPSRSLPATPDGISQTVSIPQIDKPAANLQVPPSRPAALPLRTPAFPRLNSPTFPAPKLTSTPGLPRTQSVQIQGQGQLNLSTDQRPGTGIPLTTHVMPVPKSASENAGNPSTARVIHQTHSNPAEDKPE